MPKNAVVQQTPARAAADQGQANVESSGKTRRHRWSFGARHGIMGKFKAFREDMKKEDTSIEQIRSEAKRPAIEGIGSMSTEMQRYYGRLRQRALQAEMIRQKYRIGEFRIQELNYPRDALDDAPVFETHVAFEADNMGGQHCFIGMRYTVYDPAKAVEGDPLSGYIRKRVVIGFGAAGNTLGEVLGRNGQSSEYGEAGQAQTSGNYGIIEGHCKLMNDAGHSSSVSSQTPVTKDKIISVFDAIPKFISTFNYNVLLANCNDFARTMAKIAGVSAGDLHEAVTGPMGAKDNLLNAGGTEIYYAGDMSGAKKEEIQKLLKEALEDARGLTSVTEKLGDISDMFDSYISKIWWDAYPKVNSPSLIFKVEDWNIKIPNKRESVSEMNDMNSLRNSENYADRIRNEIRTFQPDLDRCYSILGMLQFCSEQLGKALVSGNGKLNGKIIRLRKWTDDAQEKISDLLPVGEKLRTVEAHLTEYQKALDEARARIQSTTQQD